MKKATIIRNVRVFCVAACVVILFRLACPVTSGASIPVSLESAKDNGVCLGCHDDPKLKKTLADGRTISLYVHSEEFAKTVHAQRACTDCHSDIKRIPHNLAHIEKVNCGRCHYVEKIQGTRMPTKPLEYSGSIHKRALESGNANAPTCQDCHGKHDIRPPSDPKSHVYRASVPKMCGRCHIDIYSDFRESIHGQALLHGNPDVPVCTTCHGEHEIQSPKDPGSPVYATTIPETCSKCHNSKQIEKRYGIPKERYITYRESYHGVANEYGSSTVANCASCHTAHDILPASDPKSSISTANLPRTCGKCHAGANANFARGKIHVIITPQEELALYYVSSGFKWLTICTMLALVGHIMLDLYAKIRKRRSSR